MTSTTEIVSTKMDLDQLDAVVGGAAVAPARTGEVLKPIGSLIDAATGGKPPAMIDPPGATGPAKTGPAPMGVDPVMKAVQQAAADVLSPSAMRITNPSVLLDRVQSQATTIATNLGADQAVGKALAMAGLYLELTEGAASKLPEAGAMRTALASRSEDVVRGLGVAVGYGKETLDSAMTKSMDVLADAAKLVPAKDRDAILSKGSQALEDGLDKAKGTRYGKAIFGIIDDPKNADAWKDLIATKAAGSLVTGTKPVTLMCKLVETGALAKLWGGDAKDIPPEAKQAAKAISGAVSDLKDTVAEVYKVGYLGTIQNVGGLLVHGAVNLAAMGEALKSGNPDAMKAAAAKLALDAVNDLKDVVTTYYVAAPTLLYTMSSKMVMNLMNNMGATPYAEAGIAAAKAALTDFGNSAKAGIVGATAVLGDFAKMGVPGAVNELSGVARAGGQAAEAAAKAIGGVANTVGGAAAAEAGKALAELAATPQGKVAIAAATALGDLALKTGPIAQQAVRDLQNVAASTGVAAEAAAKGLATAARNMNAIGEQAGKALIDVAWRGGPGAAIIAAEGIAEMGKLWGGQAAEAVAVLRGLTTMPGELGWRSVMGLQAVAMSGAQEAAKAVGMLGDVATQGVAAVRTVAITALRGVTEAGGQMAEAAAKKLSNLATTAAGAIASEAMSVLGAIARDPGIGRGAVMCGTELVNIAKGGGQMAGQAVNELSNVAKSGGQIGQAAVKGLEDLGRAGGRIGEQAIGALGSLGDSGVAGAKKALQGLSDAGIGAAKSVIEGLKKANPFSWF